MNDQDLMFLVGAVILSTTLVVIVVQWIASRRRGRDGEGDGDGRAGWWEGPWDDDDRRR